jgi:hypothetical protein
MSKLQDKITQAIEEYKNSLTLISEDVVKQYCDEHREKGMVCALTPDACATCHLEAQLLADKGLFPISEILK